MNVVTKHNMGKHTQFVKKEIIRCISEENIVILTEFTDKNLLAEWLICPALEHSEKCAILECCYRAFNTSDKTREAKFVQKLVSLKKIVLTFMASVIAKQLGTCHNTDNNKKIARVIFEIIRNIFLILPTFSVDFIDIILPQIKLLLVASADNFDLCADIKLLEEQKRNIFATEVHAKHEDEFTELPPPPCSFRKLSIIPSMQEIKSLNKPYLRPNIIAGKYDSAEHYLDVHFRLLQEDMFRYFRECIAEYKERKLSGILSEKLQNGHVYLNCHIFEQFYDLRGQNFKCTISCKNNVNWRTTKKLSPMSLICISSDEFETFEFATIQDRDPKKDMTKICTINFMLETQNSSLFLDYANSYDIIETSAFFENYKYVLSKMQCHYGEQNFPFSSSLLHLESFGRKTTYFGTKKVSAMIQQYAYENKKVFDQHQLNAFEMALTNNLSLIQGPPGTGKTYLGLEILKWLIPYTSSSESPILVVCYTNHALDQFLEGVLAFTKKVIRIGGQCKNDVLQLHVLNKLQKVLRLQRSEEEKPLTDVDKKTLKIAELMGIRYTSMGRCIYEVKEIIKELTQIEDYLHCSKNDPLSNENVSIKLLPSHCWVKVLGSFIGSQISSERKCFHSLIEGIKDWLCVSPTSMYVYEEFPEIINYVIIGLNEAQTAWENHKFAMVPNKCSIQTFFIGMHKMCQNSNIFENSAFDDKFENLTSKKRKQLVELFLNKDICTFSVLEKAIRKCIEASDSECAKSDSSVSQLQSSSNCSVSTRNVKEIQQVVPTILPLSTKTEITFSDDESTDGEFFDPISNLILNFKKNRIYQNIGIWELSLLERWRLFLSWKDKIVKFYQNCLFQKKKELERKIQKKEEQSLMCDLSAVEHADVIGLTTTGAAKNWKLLEELNINVVLVEEAAEVLEAHILTSLTQTANHLILIGDHKQLRPNPNVYELVLKYKLDMSMFERLLTNGAPSYCLQLQHRMRPCIAELLVPTIYDRLENHSSVLEYENIKGMVHNMFFIDHQEHENKGDEVSSHVNKHEVQFLVCLCKYLLQQGYSAEHITVLTTYVGQLLLLKSAMTKKNLQNVRVCTVDNFQGEENDIILLSFVRSNDKEIIGFLKASNRVCVSLSRARKGFYCIGNFTLFASKSKLWKEIHVKLTANNMISSELPLKCERHPNVLTKVSSQADFCHVIDGGCNKKCSYRLPCGHVCTLFCHPVNDHKNISCKLKNCEKLNLNKLEKAHSQHACEPNGASENGFEHCEDIAYWNEYDEFYDDLSYVSSDSGLVNLGSELECYSVQPAEYECSTKTIMEDTIEDLGTMQENGKKVAAATLSAKSCYPNNSSHSYPLLCDPLQDCFKELKEKDTALINEHRDSLCLKVDSCNSPQLKNTQENLLMKKLYDKIFNDIEVSSKQDTVQINNLESGALPDDNVEKRANGLKSRTDPLIKHHMVNENYNQWLSKPLTHADTWSKELKEKDTSLINEHQEGLCWKVDSSNLLQLKNTQENPPMEQICGNICNVIEASSKQDTVRIGELKTGVLQESNLDEAADVPKSRTDQLIKHDMPNDINNQQSSKPLTCENNCSKELKEKETTLIYEHQEGLCWKVDSSDLLQLKNTQENPPMEKICGNIFNVIEASSKQDTVRIGELKTGVLQESNLDEAADVPKSRTDKLIKHDMPNDINNQQSSKPLTCENNCSKELKEKETTPINKHLDSSCLKEDSYDSPQLKNIQHGSIITKLCDQIFDDIEASLKQDPVQIRNLESGVLPDNVAKEENVSRSRTYQLIKHDMTNENNNQQPTKPLTSLNDDNSEINVELSNSCTEKNSAKFTKDQIDVILENKNGSEWEKLTVKEFLCKRGHKYSSDNQSKLQCNFQMTKSLACGHTMSLPCSKYNSPSICEADVQVQLPCGHKCSVLCRIRKKIDTIQCSENVKKQMICGEFVQYNCFQGIKHNCSFVSLKCGHKVSCTTVVNEYNCTLPVNVNLPCSHEILVPCNRQDRQNHVTCNKKVLYKLSCSHDKHITCHIAIQLTNSDTVINKRAQKQYRSLLICKMKCEATLPCDHKCLGECGKCVNKHRKCTEQVVRLLPCGHQQKSQCYEKNPNCSEYWNVTCNKKVLFKPSCGHEITIACHIAIQLSNVDAVINKSVQKQYHSLLMCKINCEATLPCDHKCLGKCGECSANGHRKCCKKVLFKLSCGHEITIACHIASERSNLDTAINKKEKNQHKPLMCEMNCEATLPCAHKCLGECGECSANGHRECCKKVLFKLSCGHEKNIACHIASELSNLDTALNIRAQNQYKSLMCIMNCEATLPCDHKCLGKCSECSANGHRKCTENVERLLKCGHQHKGQCYVEDPKCYKNCEINLNCNHACPGVCGQCSSLGIHNMCKQASVTILPCGHQFKKPCGAPLPICKERCIVRCSHSRCLNTCQYPCTTCQKSCDWQCVHLRCKKLCRELCDREPCDFPCARSLPCGHSCAGFCGEPCPSLCFVCNPDLNEDCKDRYVLLQDCNHSVQLKEIKTWFEKQSLDMQPSCPKCNAIITHNKRFGNMIKNWNYEFRYKFMNIQFLNFNDPNEISKFQGQKYLTIYRDIANQMLKLNVSSCYYVVAAFKMGHNYNILSSVLSKIKSMPKSKSYFQDIDTLNELNEWIEKHKADTSQQQTQESCRAVRRIAILCFIRYQQLHNKSCEKSYSKLIEILESKPFSFTMESNFLQEVDKLLNDCPTKSLQEFIAQLNSIQNSSNFDITESLFDLFDLKFPTYFNAFPRFSKLSSSLKKRPFSIKFRK